MGHRSDVATIVKITSSLLDELDARDHEQEERLTFLRSDEAQRQRRVMRYQGTAKERQTPLQPWEA